MPSWSRSRRPWNRCGSNKIGIAIKIIINKNRRLSAVFCACPEGKEFLIKLIGKILLLPVVLLLTILRLLIKIRMEVTSFIFGTLMLIVFSCIIFTIVQHTWNYMLILIAIEVFLVLITARTGVIEGVLQMASKSLDGFMRS